MPETDDKDLPRPVKVSFDGPLGVSMIQNAARPSATSGPVPLWVAIQNRSIDFNAYSRFITKAFCCETPRYENGSRDASGPGRPPEPLTGRLKEVMSKLRSDAQGDNCVNLGWLGRGVNAYQLLKTATEIFLLLECGAFIAAYVNPGVDPCSISDEQRGHIPGAEGVELLSADRLKQLQEALAGYLGGDRLPYIERILASTFGANVDDAERLFPFCEGFLKARANCPCFIELIWSYWHEEGMLVQSLNALSLRFQNRQRGEGRDPLAQLELSPLRPLSALLWGYVQEEQHRLSLVRRAYEYEHEYGLTLLGKAVPQLRAADRRSKFLAGFHDLLFRCAVFYRESSNLQIVPDTFPLLNGLKEVHLVLSQGAGNQFGDLPWTARVEMLIQQWLLARSEIREFLGRRPMVVYEEDWMANADAMKSLMGWTDTSISHFRNLGVFGEKLLLSIRWHEWASVSDSQQARDWAVYFRPQIQGYIHAYRVATGIDLAAEPKTPEDGALRAQVPALILERRRAEARSLEGK